MIQQSIEIGPIHKVLPGAMKMGIGLCGDEIESVDTEFGYLSKGLLAKAEGKSIFDAQLRLSRLEPESALIVDQMIAGCVEEVFAAEVSARAFWIRDVILHVSDLGAALKFLALMSKRMKIAPLTQVILRHREDLMDLVELLTGSRFGYDYVIPGGVRFDLSHGFSERLEKWIKAYQQDFPRIESMFYWIAYHENYLRQIGGVVDTGDLGFVSRGKKEETRLGWVSNVKSRLDFILNSSVELGDKLSHLLDEQVDGEFKLPFKKDLKKQDSKQEIQTLRGDWLMDIKLQSDHSVKKIVVVTPSDHSVKAIPESLIHERMDDLPLILQSLNFIVAEIDK